jgi:hypothetical protein
MTFEKLVGFLLRKVTIRSELQLFATLKQPIAPHDIEVVENGTQVRVRDK